jgi:anthranilate phosphoribosyltransferase
MPELRRRIGGPPPQKNGEHTMKLESHLATIEAGKHLTRSESESVMEELLTGHLADEQIVQLLSAMRDKGESVDELVGFATVMRRHAKKAFDEQRIPASELVDTCGTGGASRGTFNISTAAAFVAAGAGVRVAKHGNRSYTSRSGSADVLEALGVRVDLAPDRAGDAIDQIGIGFLYAPAAHSAARFAIPARRRLGGHTIFNLLGPLTNPAGAGAQVLGVFAAKWVEPMARALAELGSHHAFVVHGDDGLGEISLSGGTLVAQVRGQEAGPPIVNMLHITPEDFGLERAPLEQLAGGDPAQNAAILRAILQGEHGPRRDIVVANAAAAIVAAGRAAGFREGAQLANKSIDSRAALDKLLALIEFTNR